MACGQKGPPLAPLHLVPAAVSEPTARRVADRVRLRFVLPTRNANGPGPVDLDRVEVYAMTVAAGAPLPPNRVLLTKTYLVGAVPVRPAAAEGEAPKEGDTRPEPGAAVTFDETLDAAKLTPVPSPVAPATATGATPPSPGEVPKSLPEQPATTATPAAPVSTAPDPPTPTPPTPTPATPAPATPPPAGPPPAAGQPAAPAPGGAAAAPAGAQPPVPPLPPPPKYPTRIYAVRGVTKSGRPGPPSTRMEVSLIPVPSPPLAVSSRVTESGIALEWKVPTEPPLPLSYNVYRRDDPMQPINTAPIAAAAFEYTGAALGEEQCFGVRGISLAGVVLTEGPMSEETCVTPRDVFPPAAPKRLDAVPTPGQISLIWEPNTEKDLAGYIVLRGDAPDGMLQALTAAPIRETSYSDTTVKPGVRYVYAVVAIDSATPPNMSAQSPRVEETAR